MLETQMLYDGLSDGKKSRAQCGLVHIHNLDGMRLDEPLLQQLAGAMKGRPQAILVVGRDQWFKTQLSSIPTAPRFLPKKKNRIYKRLVGRTTHQGYIFLLERET